jgi:hypothetical protein
MHTQEAVTGRSVTDPEAILREALRVYLRSMRDLQQLLDRSTYDPDVVDSQLSGDDPAPVASVSSMDGHQRKP